MKSLLVLVLLAAYFATGESLKCYDCTNPPHSSCGESFDAKGDGVKIAECQSPSSCLKSVMKIGSETRISRYCSINAGDFDKAGAKSSLEEVRHHICDTDYCNGSTITSATLGTLVSLTIFTLFTNLY